MFRDVRIEEKEETGGDNSERGREKDESFQKEEKESVVCRVTTGLCLSNHYKVVHRGRSRNLDKVFSRDVEDLFRVWWSGQLAALFSRDEGFIHRSSKKKAVEVTVIRSKGRESIIQT